jgi:hypothetical protein
MIYFIQDADGLIKIGTTIRLSQRLKQLNSERKQELKVLGVVDGSYADEAVLHLRFAHSRVLGEWFQPTDELNDFIATDARPWDGIDEKPEIYSVVKIDGAILDKARLVAASLGMSTADYVSEIARESVYRDFDVEMNRLGYSKTKVDHPSVPEAT